VIQESIKKPLADELLFGNLVGGGRALVVVEEGDKLGFEFVTRDFLKGETKKSKRAKKKAPAKVSR
jgi:ATP-dependent Clp protease ATP-binding subunit ClpA